MVRTKLTCSLGFSALFAALAILPLSAAEKRTPPKQDKIKIIEGSSSIELPRRDTLNGRVRSGFDQEGPGPDTSGYLTPPPPQTSKEAERKLRDALDKKRNWIFVNPYESDYDSRQDEMLGGKSDQDYERKALGQGEKTTVERYISERNGSSEERGKDNERSQFHREKNEQIKAEDAESGQLSSTLDSNRDNPANFSVSRDRERSFLQGRQEGLFGRPLNSSRNSTGFDVERFDSRRALVQTPQRESLKPELQQQQQLRDKEFDQLIAPRHGAVGFSPRMDPINTQIDSTRIDINPVIADRPDPVRSFDFSGPRKSFLAENPLAAPKVDLPAASSFSDLLPKAPTVSPVAPSVNAANPSFAPPPQAPRPFVFERPRPLF